MRTDAPPINDRLQSRGFAHVVRWTIVLALWTLLISMAIGKFGISNYVQLKDNAASLAESNLRLALENQVLEEDLEALKTSESAREQLLAREIGLVREGKRIVHFEKVPGHPRRPTESSETNSYANRSLEDHQVAEASASARL